MISKISALILALFVVLGTSEAEAATYIGIKDGGKGAEYYNHNNWLWSNPDLPGEPEYAGETFAWFRIPGKDGCVMYHNLPGTVWYNKYGAWHEYCWK